MKQLDTALASEATRDRAHAYLDKFTKTAFHQVVSAEEGDLLAEMLKGASVAIASKVGGRLVPVVQRLKLDSFSLSMQAYSALLRS